MAKYGLIGRNLPGSQSQLIHMLLGDHEYDLIGSPDAAGLAEILSDSRYSGFYITDPYKKEIVRYLDELSDDARRVDAVNVIQKQPGGRLSGHNTEPAGFRYMAKGLAGERKCLILGTGHAAVTAAEALSDLGAGAVVMVSRDPEAARMKLGKRYEITGYNRLYTHYDSHVIINATPAGQLPGIEHSPLADNNINIRMFTDLELVIDMIYDPYRTKLLQDSRRITGCHTKSGLDMLASQVIYARGILAGEYTPDEEIERLIRPLKKRILEDQLNIVAVGMPGSGKTTILRRYAYEMGLRFIDTDEETEKLMGRPVSSVLRPDGAGLEYFRAMEHIAVREACRSRGAVIATGGGTVLNPLNRDYMRSNGIVVYIRRPLDMLDLKGRPLSIGRGVEALFGERDRIYRRVSDITVYNTRIFGGGTGPKRSGNSYNRELKGFVYHIARKIERYLNEIADNQWT